MGKKKGAISAGPGLPPDDEVDIQLAFRDDWLEQYGGPENLTVMTVEGDSMEPTLYQNDVVLIDRNYCDIKPGGGIFAVRWNNAVMVKRLQLEPRTHCVKIKSDNPNYDTQEAPVEDIQIEGKVIWYGRELK